MSRDLKNSIFWWVSTLAISVGVVFGGLEFIVGPDINYGMVGCILSGLALALRVLGWVLDHNRTRKVRYR